MKIIVEHHPDGFVAYPPGLKGVVVGEGDTYEQAVADVSSAIRFHLDTFGSEAFEDGGPKKDGMQTKILVLLVPFDRPAQATSS